MSYAYCLYLIDIHGVSWRYDNFALKLPFKSVKSLCYCHTLLFLKLLKSVKHCNFISKKNHCKRLS